MRNVILLHVLIFGAVVSSSCSGTSTTDNPAREAGKAQVLADSSQLAVSLEPQVVDEWCWAASGEMIMKFLGVTVAQCDEANKEFGFTACCPSSTSDPVPGDCNKPGWPEFEKYGFEYSKTQNVALGWDELRRQIAVLKSPIAFSWGWTGGGGHMMVATGYQTIAAATGSQRFVTINDPWPPSKGDQTIITYEEYDQVQGDHVHWDDYYNIRRK